MNQILLGLIAALGCLVGGTLLLPSLATDELREVLADIVQKCGYSISGYASRVFPPDQVSLQYASLDCLCSYEPYVDLVHGLHGMTWACTESMLSLV